MVIMKFGGKSLANMQKIENICKYIKKRLKNEQIVVVVSAFGNTTDALLQKAQEYGGNNLREIDTLIATGEMQSASLFALALQKIGVKAKSFLGFQVPIITTGMHGSAAIKSIGKTEILQCVQNGQVAVVAGFQGIDDKKEISTLGRGGSDTTAVALGAAFKCKVEIYSDFDGIYQGDPRRKKPYTKFKTIDYDSLIALSRTGAKVVAEDASWLAKQANVELECKGSNCPEIDGTTLVDLPQPFAAINVNENLSEVSIVYNKSVFQLAKILNFVCKELNFLQINVTKTCIKVLLYQADAAALEQFFVDEKF